MAASVDHVVHNVLAPMAINVLDCIVPVLRQVVISIHEFFLADHREPEPVIDVSRLIPSAVRLVLMVNDSGPEISSDRETVVNPDALSGLLSDISQSIRNLARSTYDTMSALGE
ncbi:uncharacterized protein LOC108095095 [Drosophila ficusphila]|uniref:uncharacterized protein LOC108095095 n=1 Tax=Drosophila ficusphila TaxID=30025 RepID=UPI0007E7E454|nr:uncharacterized protein LOC108095095 [Drosophila ficusphila]